MRQGELTSFLGELEKIAVRALTRFIRAKPAEEAAKVIKGLPPNLRSEQAYKELGHRAARAASKVPDTAGHGAQHIFNVTRNVQALSKQRAPATRRRATLSSLLHDVGRGAEGRAKTRVGKKVFKRSPEMWHSELGGRYSKDFLRKNKALSRYTPEMQRGRLSGAVRAHDTDIHPVKPWLESRLKADPAAGATYLADKMEGLGRTGAERTVAMAKKFKEPLSETKKVVDKNLKKYKRVIGSYAKPEQARVLTPKLREYQKTMEHYDATGRLPEMGKAASVNDFARLYRATLAGKMSEAQLVRTMGKLSKHVKDPAAEMFSGIYKLPADDRLEMLKILGSKLPTLPK